MPVIGAVLRNIDGVRAVPRIGQSWVAVVSTSEKLLLLRRSADAAPAISGLARGTVGASWRVLDLEFFDRLGPDKCAGAHDQFGATLPELVEMHCDQAVDHLPLACSHLYHVHSRGKHRGAELCPAIDQVRHLGALNLVLARQAVGVGAYQLALMTALRSG